ncbi:MAG: glycosyltransferase [Pseudanabaenaceae cyanobacterium bins.39]|nr:glycosyltransferase [Pseudanabaenaceae cyanobacterium bins.39]
MLALPKVTIVIPIYNCAANLSLTLDALIHQDFQGEIEIIAVDNNSTDDSKHIVQQYPQVIYTNQTAIQNAAATRNQGIQMATGDIIALIDGDCIPETNWISRSVHLMLDQGVPRIGGKIGVKPLSVNSSIYALIDALFCFNQESAIRHLGTCMTGNFITRKDVFVHVGLFNQDYYEMEDIEFGIRAIAADLAILYADTAIVWHPPRTTFQEMWHKSKRNGRGTFILCQKNSQWSGRWGWKHLPRCCKTLVSLRHPDWQALPFDDQLIPWNKKFKIYWLAWIVINLGEACGYLKSWIRFMARKDFA